MGDEMLATLFGTEFAHSCMDGLCIGKFKFSSDREDYLIWLSPIREDISSINSFTLNLFHVPTSDTFSGHFTTAYVSQLTQKTGSIKDFKTFLNMLKSALSQRSRSVRIEFLSTEEIQALKGSTATTGHTHKCYILLSYSSEYDQVRYPIPLTFIGKLNHLTLLECVLNVQYSKGGNILEARQADRAREKDREEIDRLLHDKRELEEEIQILRHYQRREDSEIPSKEIKVLKRVIRSLEQDLLIEKSQHKKYTSKKNDEYSRIGSELDRLRASERTLKIRVKNLTEELATIRRHRVSMSPIVSSTQPGRKRSLSADRGKSCTPVSRGTSKERFVRRRSSSLEKPITSERMSRRQEYLHSQQNMVSRSRTPSPRFDPTAYIRERTRKQTESGGKKNRPPSFPNQRNGHPIRSRSHSRESYRAGVSNGGRWSHYSSASSLDSSPDEYMTRDGNYRRNYSRESLHSLNSIRDSSTPVHKNNKRAFGSKCKDVKQPKSKTKQSLDHSINLTDIDQRLKALKFLIHDH